MQNVPQDIQEAAKNKYPYPDTSLSNAKQIEQIAKERNIAATLKWRKIDPDNLPEGDVLISQEADIVEIGEIEPGTKPGVFRLVSNWRIATHYILISDLFTLKLIINN